MIFKMRTLSVFTVLPLFGALLVSTASPALANGVTYASDVEIPACTTVGASPTEGRIVCFDEAGSSLQRGDLDIPFALSYSDRGEESGSQFSLRVEQVTCDGSMPTNCLVPGDDINALSPFAGDVGKFIIKYPNTDSPLVNGTEQTISRGLDLASAAYASTKAASFYYEKEVTENVVIFEIDITYVKVWDRQGCRFSDVFNEESRLFAPTDECNQPNTGNSGTDSFGYLWNEIAIWTGDALWSGSDMDGLFLNTRAPSGSIGTLPAVTVTLDRLTASAGQGVAVLEILLEDNKKFFGDGDGYYYPFSPTVGDKFFLTGVAGLSLSNAVTVTEIVYEDTLDLITIDLGVDLEENLDLSRGDLTGAMATLPGSIDFQEIGPKFADGTNLNLGALEIFIPEGYLKYIFGGSSSDEIDISDLLAQRVDVLSEAEILVQNLTAADNGLTVAELSTDVNRGILITVASHGYSAPGFSFASTDKAPLVSTASPTVVSGGGFVAQQPVVQQGPKIKATLERAKGSRVKLAKLRSLADFNLKPGQKVRIRIAKSSRLDCRVEAGRVVSITGEACLIRATKILANGSKSKQKKLIRLVYR